jgi:putative ABC transport system permease protein
VDRGLEKAKQFKLELAKFPGITGMCTSSHDFANGAWVRIGYTDDRDVYRTFNMNVVDDQYIPMLKMEMASGRNFSDEIPADKRHSVIVNEAFVREYGWKDPIGMKIPGKNFADHQVIGVVKDFNYASLYAKVGPLVIVEDASIIFKGIENIDIDNVPIPKLMLRLEPGNMSATMDQVKTVWSNITGGEEFRFTFVDQAITEQYRSDLNLGRIVNIATVLAIIIGSLGLYGLASLAMQNRVKEISIRKVLGATQQSILLLLSKDYVYLILISLLLSVPVTIYLMKGWLSAFEYRVAIGWTEFLLSGGISLLIALGTISYQTIKTALTQPAETLKYE